MISLMGFVKNKTSLAEVYESPSPEIITNKEKNILRCHGIKHGRSDTRADALQAMIKNTQKAYTEAIDPNFSTIPNASSPYFKPASVDLSAPLLSITYRVESAEDKSYRSSMNDFHFYHEMTNGCLLGIFDGAGGASVSEYANRRFKEIFSEEIVNSDHIRQAFEHTFEILQKEIVNQSLDICADKSLTRGSAAIICFLEKDSNLLYTATLGDSEANIVRAEEILPLSTMRIWRSSSDRKRAIILSNGSWWPNLQHPAIQSLTVSRSLGYSNSTGGKNDELKVVIQKCKVSVTKVQPHDVVILASKGLKNFVPVKDVIDEVGLNTSTLSLPQRLVDLSLKKQKPNEYDNVTVISLRIDQMDVSKAAAPPSQ